MPPVVPTKILSRVVSREAACLKSERIGMVGSMKATVIGSASRVTRLAAFP
jgi:hypothetical protein